MKQQDSIWMVILVAAVSVGVMGTTLSLFNFLDKKEMESGASAR